MIRTKPELIAVPDPQTGKLRPITREEARRLRADAEKDDRKTAETPAP